MAIINQPNQPNNAQPQAQSMSQDQSRQRQTRGTGFTNISKVLDANKGAGKKIGDKIASDVGGQAQSVREGIQAGQAQFGQNLQQGVQNVQQQFQPAQSMVRQSGESDEAYSNRIASANGDYAKIGENLRNAQYQGPQGLEQAGRLQGQAATTAALGRLAGTQQGQGELLRKTIAGRGRYTSGQGSLDQLLLGQEGQQGVQQARRATIGLNQAANTAVAGAEQQAQGALGALETQRQDINKGITSGVESIDAYGKAQAEQFQREGTDLQSIINGNFIADTPEKQQYAQNLINNSEKYGINDTDVYTGGVNFDANKYNSALSSLAGGFTRQENAKMFRDQDKLAGKNLATILNDQARAKAFQDASFDTDLFKTSESDAFKSLTDTEAKDKMLRDKLLAAGSSAKATQDKAIAKNNEIFEQQKTSALANKALTQEDKDNLIEYLARHRDNANNQINTGQMPTLNKMDFFKAGLLEKAGINTQNPLFTGTLNAGMQGNSEYAQGYNQGTDLYSGDAGMLKFADRNIDKESNTAYNDFRNLGLSGSTGANSGDLRRAQEFFNAAEKLKGEKKSLKSRLLEKLAKK